MALLSTAVYREIDVDLYQGIIEESQKKNSRWQITLDTKTAMKILDIDEDVIEGFIKEGNAYEVVKVLCSSVQKQNKLWLLSDCKQRKGKKDVCEDLALIHDAFLCLCKHVDKAGIKISNVNYEPEEDSNYKEVYQIELMEKFKKLSTEIIKSPSNEINTELKKDYRVSPEMAKVIAERRNSVVIQVEGIKINQEMVYEVQTFLMNKNERDKQRRKSVIGISGQNQKIAEERRHSQRRKSQVYEAIVQARRSSLALPDENLRSKSMNNLSPLN